jgi:hypothetical protein
VPFLFNTLFEHISPNVNPKENVSKTSSDSPPPKIGVKFMKKLTDLKEITLDFVE